MQLSSSKRKTFLSFQPPAIGPEEIAAVTETLESGWLTSGPRAEELERRLAELTGARHALALASGTAAMHLSLVGLGIGVGDEVITTPITWPATANVIVHTGATPVFVDVRDAYQHALAEENIGTSIHFLPVHTLTYYRERFPGVSLPVAEKAGVEVLSLPFSPAHSDDDVADAIDALTRVYERFAP